MEEAGALTQMSCDHTDCESIEDSDEEEEGDFSGDDDLRSSDETETQTQCNAPPLYCLRSEVEVTPQHHLTSRVLLHPTFEAHYTAAAIHHNLETTEMRQRRHEGFTANPGEYFYVDPLLSPGQRVYNFLSPSSLHVFGCFRLQAPPPIMSSCVFPSIYEDNPMDDDDEVLEEPADNGGHMDVAPDLFPSVLEPSPSLYTASELEAVNALLCLSMGCPPLCPQ
ncbi:histone deacetylase complex subunit SAP25 [Engystomops pustulosus]|uniref:uncharacterized protein n=1 Tax=Engystomops pustulosus TaxID=76066 RepID=UPI003AFB0152